MDPHTWDLFHTWSGEDHECSSMHSLDVMLYLASVGREISLHGKPRMCTERSPKCLANSAIIHQCLPMLTLRNLLSRCMKGPVQCQVWMKRGWPYLLESKDHTRLFLQLEQLSFNTPSALLTRQVVYGVNCVPAWNTQSFWLGLGASRWHGADLDNTCPCCRKLSAADQVWMQEWMLREVQMPPV